MKLKNFFGVIEEGPGGTAFQPAQPPVSNEQGPSFGNVEPEELSRWDKLPVAIRTTVKDVERQCSKLARRNDNDPELKEIIHKFLLDLNRYMGEGE